MDIVLMIIAGILLIAGFLGCILPVLPGVPLSYTGIIVLQLTDKVQFSTGFLVIWAVIVIAVQALDYFIPAWGAKKFGGSKAGIYGSIIGMIVGLFFGPLGIIFGPFIGAVVGELVVGKNSPDALRAGFGTFIGFLAGTAVKLVVAGFLIFYYIKAIV